MTQQQRVGGSQAPGRGQRSIVEERPRRGLFPTQNYLSEDVRTTVIERLDRTLADTTVLLTHAKFAHWNVKGMEFYGLHQLFEEIAEAFDRHADEIAERIAALGGQVMGTAEMAVEGCTLPSMPADAVTGAQFVEALADRLAIHDANLCADIDAANACGDPDTADLLNEVSREVSHYLWFPEAHLQTQPLTTGPSGAGPSGRGEPTPSGRGPPSTGARDGQVQQPQSRGPGR